MQIDVLRRAPGRRIPARGIRNLARTLLLALEQPPSSALSVLISDDATLQQLNRDHRGKDRPTDVLSFSMREGGGLPPALQHALLGDIAISLDSARRQARERGWSLELEVGFLLLHGILHLLGYDHESDEDAEVMEALTQQLWVPLLPRVEAIALGKDPGDG